MAGLRPAERPPPRTRKCTHKRHSPQKAKRGWPRSVCAGGVKNAHAAATARRITLPRRGVGGGLAPAPARLRVATGAGVRYASRAPVLVAGRLCKKGSKRGGPPQKAAHGAGRGGKTAHYHTGAVFAPSTLNAAAAKPPPGPSGRAASAGVYGPRAQQGPPKVKGGPPKRQKGGPCIYP